MRVASYNIHKCRGTDGQVRPDRIVQVLKEIGPQLVALQEVDHRFGQRIGLLDPVELKREAGLHLLAQSDAPEGHGWHGNALLVAGEPTHYRRLRLRLPGIEPRGAIISELDLGEGQFRVIAAHFGLLRRSRVSQANALLAAFKDLPPMPTILLGDLNEWRRKRRSALNVFEPLFGEAHPLPSFPSRRPIFPLDRIIGWPRGLINDLAVHNTPLARKASDHLPLVARIDLSARVGDVRSAA
ncbi:endonuclease/exonuclease/phosphatase family protein [Hansschlegelia beijingensis]|uniref:Endonuclease/exonuclease/phosphatase family metal-dependent hydrolase n=1 Tax=Hansschlegelia beijingensis TaxID=1133344 RepID=A0A7W6CWR0_9HYPH|nr:endonuclease/exonuclease/phosphatase family protein [Hansschlegelia beijingensis]MBB3972486.1 endonuclease/exonuclease/phosphatase family metal-dependent hydrolase [Hansschlegelia beijingensis]